MSVESARPVHQVRKEYTSLREALIDAQRVSADIRRIVDGELLVPAGEVDFLCRRLQQFTKLCLDNLPAGVSADEVS